MITFTRKTQCQVFMAAGSADELKEFAEGLEAAGNDVAVAISQANPKAGVALFRTDTALIKVLPPTGTTWAS